MGKCKADLPWSGTTLIDFLVQKLCKEGFPDIILSGYTGHIDGARSVPDIFTGRGPLCGIHAGLSAAKNPVCLILSVDMPLIRPETLSGLIFSHLNQSNPVTVLEHNGQLEPLLGIYDKSILSDAEKIIHEEHSSVKILFQRCGYSKYSYNGDERFLMDCDTPEDYSALKKMEEYL